MERDKHRTISTHALTWSATKRSHPKRPRPKFQLTRSRGARPFSIDKLGDAMNFNSRAHVERDHFAHELDRMCSAFQLTRSRGARPVNRVIKAWREISTHALTWSATRTRPPTQWPRSPFQLTRSRGARLFLTLRSASRFLFQLTRSRGARLVDRLYTLDEQAFQLTRSRGARP